MNVNGVPELLEPNGWNRNFFFLSSLCRSLSGIHGEHFHHLVSSSTRIGKVDTSRLLGVSTSAVPVMAAFVSLSVDHTRGVG